MSVSRSVVGPSPSPETIVQASTPAMEPTSAPNGATRAHASGRVVAIVSATSPMVPAGHGPPAASSTVAAAASASGSSQVARRGECHVALPGHDQPALVGRDHGLHAVACAELRQHAAHVGLHGRLAKDQPLGDLPVGEPVRHQLEHLALALGELLEAGRHRRPGRRPADEAVEQAPGHLGREQRVARHRRAHAPDELLGRRALQEEAARAGAYALVQVLVEVEGGEDHDARVRLGAGQDAARGLDAVHHRHLDVDQDDVRVQLAHRLDRLAAVAGLADHLEVVLGLEHQLEAAAKQHLIVGEEHAGHAGAPSSGRRARTAKPPSGVGAASSSPPKMAARSRMPASPWPPESAATRLPPPSRTSTTTASSR